MKKLLLLISFFGFSFGFSGGLKAQSIKEPTNISQKSDDGILVAYPNPAKDFLILKSKDSSKKIKSVTFYSILGVEVATYNINMSSGEIRLDKLKPGKYLMRYLMSDNTQKVTQIIKQ